MRALVLSFASLLVACSSSSSTSGSSGGDGGSFNGSSSGSSGSGVPRVIVDAKIAPGSHATCASTTELAIGAFTSTPMPVDSGGQTAVTCSVIPQGDAFAVSAVVSTNGGALQVDGTFTTAGDQNGIQIRVEVTPSADYASKQCVARYAGPQETVAAGRVWAEFDCPDALQTAPASQCEITGQFRLENCKQQ